MMSSSSRVQKDKTDGMDEDLSGWLYLDREECESDQSLMSEADDAMQLNVEVTGPERGQGDVNVACDEPSQTRQRNTVSFSRADEELPSESERGCSRKALHVDGAESSDFVCLGEGDRASASDSGASLSHQPPFYMEEQHLHLSREGEDAPSGCDDLCINVVVTPTTPKNVTSPKQSTDPRNEDDDDDEDEENGKAQEDGYASECSSSNVSNPPLISPYASDANATSSNQRSANTAHPASLVDYFSGPKIMLILLVALLSLGIGHLIGQGKFQHEQDQEKQLAELKEVEQMEKIQNLLSEKLTIFNEELNAERNQWKTQLEQAHLLLADMKKKLDLDSNEKVAGERKTDMNREQMLKQFSEKYSLTESDQQFLEKLVLQKDFDDSDGADSPNVASQMSKSLLATREFLQSYLQDFQQSIKNLNLTSSPMFNMSQENILNVSEVLRVSEIVGNTVFDAVGEKLSQISDFKDNLTLSQIEEFANSQAEATVSRLNNVVSKTVEKLVSVKDEITENKHLQKLKREADKAVDKFIKTAVDTWNSFTNVFTGSPRKRDATRMKPHGHRQSNSERPLKMGQNHRDETDEGYMKAHRREGKTGKGKRRH